VFEVVGLVAGRIIKDPGAELLGVRRWIAWKLVRLAARIYDPEHYERVWVEDPHGRTVFEAVIVADVYGCGLSSVLGREGEVLPAGSMINWDWDYRPDWLDE